uniref:Uncharacterized protein n=1 Tax=Glossina brevipalpis TaxID=37001 RepID=A0A1A9X414_9MUSC
MLKYELEVIDSQNQVDLLNVCWILLMFLSYTCAVSVLFPLISIVRTPENDKAIIESARVNGNFAYSTIEGHAYKTITTMLGQVLKPGPLAPVNQVYVE